MRGMMHVWLYSKVADRKREREREKKKTKWKNSFFLHSLSLFLVTVLLVQRPFSSPLLPAHAFISVLVVHRATADLWSKAL